VPHSHLHGNGYSYPNEGGRRDSKHADSNRDAHSHPDPDSLSNSNCDAYIISDTNRYTVTRSFRYTYTDERPLSNPYTYGNGNSHNDPDAYPFDDTDMRLLRSRNRDQYLLL
jgi:hypothetical protein